MARAALLSRVLARPRAAKRPAAGRTAEQSDAKWFTRAFAKRSAPASTESHAKPTTKTSTKATSKTSKTSTKPSSKSSSKPSNKPSAKSSNKPTTKPTAKTSTRRTAAPAAKGRPGPRRPLLAALGRALAMACAFAFMVAFAVVLAKLTLQPSPASEALTHTNLRPGDSLRAYLDQPQLRDAAKQVGGNLLLGVPFGVLVPVVAPRARGVVRVLLLTAVVMLAVELAQGAMITGRAFDIDDVILNTTGALAGYLLMGRRLGRTVHARR
ncbi:VanZ family protein [Streptomyces sp. NPDC002309]